ncbi:unnamed protein product [Oikopleura dioica]|uniref:Peptidase S1 domain-containing protein n=1 Tax=Oikopleura dioica TaxID=34765 RepID=E4X8S4_OIKDI|nr:unnamed protein product [Oikopleura dioica]
MAQPHVSSPEQPNELEGKKTKNVKNKNAENSENQAENRTQSRSRARRIANGKVFLLIFALVLIIGGGIGVAVYFGVSAIISGVAPETVNENIDGKNNSSSGSKSNSTSLSASDSNTTSASSSASSTATPTSMTVETTTSELQTTTEIPYQSIPRRLTPCNGTGGIIDSPWSWAVKIVYKTIAQEFVEANLTTNAAYEYDEIIEEIINLEKNRVCGGSIIHEHYILTSGRCCNDILNSENGEAKILLGLDLIERRSSNFTIHPDYSPLKAIIGDKNDVCLVFSEKNMFFSGEEALSTTQACLPDFDDHVNAGEFCFTAGFGSYIDENEADRRRTPNEVEVRIINDRACRRSEISSSNFIWNVHFCADFIRKDPQIACGGDLGASLICIHGNKPVIYGISSFAKNCGDPSWPGTYAKVSQYVNWIQETISA